MALESSWNEIVAQISQVWDSIGPFRTIIILAIPVVAWLTRKPLADLLLKLLKVIAKGIGISVAEKVEASIIRAVQVFVVAFGGLIAHENVHLPDPYYGFVEKLLISVCVAAVFAAIYALCDYIPQLFEKKKAIRAPEQISLTVRFAQFMVVFVGIAAVLKVWGIDIGPVLTGMGLAGAAVALAGQDILKNLLAGFSNAHERRFREGDWIRVDGLIEGTVETVDLRSTMVRRFDTAPVHVPNSELAAAPLINFSRLRYRRIYWQIALNYGLSIEVLREIRDRVEQHIDDCGYFVSADVASRFVRIDSFNESSIDMLVYCFIKSNKYSGYLEAKEHLVLAIKSIVLEAGGAFAFPSRSIYIEASADAGPARFIGSKSSEQSVE